MTDIQKQKIKLLRSSGKSYRDIAAEMDLNVPAAVGAVHSLWNISICRQRKRRKS